MSSDEEDSIVCMRKKTKKSLVIVDDPEDDEQWEAKVGFHKEPEDDSEKVESALSKPIIDGSDSDEAENRNDDSPIKTKSGGSKESIIGGNDSDDVTDKNDDSPIKKKSVSSKKTRIITNSDSEDESDSSDKASEKKASQESNKSLIGGSDSDDVTNKDDDSPVKKRFKKFADKDIYDAEDSSDGEDGNKIDEADVTVVDVGDSERHSKPLMDSDIYAADESSDEDGREAGSEQGVGSLGRKKSSNSKRKSSGGRDRRATAEARSSLDEVHSEAQRLVRQSRVRLPYHTPRQRSLHHFLQRRSLPPLPLVRTSAQSIKHLWEQLEEKEKEAEILYKSESDEDDLEDVRPASAEQRPPEKQVSFALAEMKQSEGNGIPPLHVVEDTTEDAPLDTRDSLPPGGTDVTDSGPTESGYEMIVPEKTSEAGVEEVVTVKTSLAEDAVAVETSSAEDAVAAETSAEDAVEVETSAEVTLAVETSAEEAVVKEAVPMIKPPQSGEVIELDLDDGTEGGETPVDSFIRRFTKHAAIKPKRVKEEKQVDISILSTEYDSNGELVKLCEETVSVKCGGGNGAGCGGGRAKMAALRASLRQAMAHDRHLRLERNKVNYQLDEEKIEDDELLFDDEEVETSNKGSPIKSDTGDYILDDDDIDDDDVVSSSSDEDDGEGAKDSDGGRKKGDYSRMFVDDEAEVSDIDETETRDGDNEREDEDGSGNSGKEDDLCGSEVENENNDDDGATMDSSIPQSQEGSFNESFFKSDKEADSSIKDEEKLSTPTDSQLMALCSGKFDSQPIGMTDLETETSQDFRLKLSEGFDSQHDIKIVDSSRRILDSSDDEDTPATANESKTKKRRRKLQFSDDEEDDNNVGDQVSASEHESEAEEEAGEDDNLEEGGEDIVDEEYEEFMSMDKGKAAAGFFDEQAELSGSEYEGSADEDEEGLDILEDTEEADREAIDQAKVKRELGRLHIKDMLADDNREIRLLKELLLEDGELHSDGPKRQRLFRWSNQQDGDFDKKWASIDDVDDAKYKEDDEEDEDEASWRKDRLHRQTFLQKNSSRLEEEEETKLEPNVVIGGRLAKRTSSTGPVPPPKPSAATSPDPKNIFTLRTKRGSFLSRGQQVLSRLATLTGGEGGAGAAAPGQKPTRRNMVFAVVSPPKQNDRPLESETATSKRKCSYEASTSMRIIKKLKLSEMTTEEQCISVLERLRQSDIMT